MTSRQTTPSIIAAEFPGRDALIGDAYREDLSFRDLCRDYRTCAETLEVWRRSDDEAASSRAREYAELLAQLSGEVESWLEAMESGSRPPRRGGPQ
ncbi:MAG: hypothetical protein PVG53_02630 [Holophagae bacterium]